MKKQPRDYQVYARNSVINYFRNGGVGNPLVAMPTGTGKSVVIADLLWYILSHWGCQRILVLTHVKELIEQNYDELLEMWPSAPAGIYSSGIGRRDTMQPIIFGGIASVIKKWAELGRFDLVFVDECHLVNPEEAGMYRTLFGYLKIANPHLKVVGFTATPWKLGHGSIVEDGIFTDICCDMTGVEAFNWLIAQGYLCPVVPKKTALLLNTDGVHMRGNEFIPSELQTAVDKEHITRAALKEAATLGADRNSWLIFASGVEHACHIAEMLNNEFGISAVAIHGKLSKTARKDAIEGFKSGKYRVAVNNNVLTTGFNHPGIDMIVMLRPTASAVLWVQMLGRGTRPLYVGYYDLTTQAGRLQAIHESDKHNCLVLDFAGNTKRLGPINDPVKPHRKGEGGGEAPVKECPHCNTWNHASVRFCGGVSKHDTDRFDPTSDYCGEEFHFETKLKQAASTEALIKSDAPIVEVFKIDHITCIKHVNQNGEMMKVSYYCGYKCFTEFVAPDHPKQGMRTAARTWVTARGGNVYPESTAQLLDLVESLTTPTHLRVWINQKYPRILATDFTGTAFGTQQPTDTPVTIQAHKTVSSSKHTPGAFKAQDSDIPFTDAEMKAGARPAPNFADMDDDIPF